MTNPIPFNDHLDACKQCSDYPPFELCPVGSRLLALSMDATEGTDQPCGCDESLGLRKRVAELESKLELARNVVHAARLCPCVICGVLRVEDARRT